MKTYLFIYDVEVDSTELIMKVQPLYCANDKVDFLPINDKDYTPTKGDKLYFLPGVNIPRVKLKDLSLQHGVKTVRDIDQATHVFCSKNTKDKLVTSHWYYQMPTQKFRDLLADADDMMDDYYKENLREALEHYTEDVVIVDYTSASELRNAELSVIQKHIGNGALRSSNVYYTVDDDHKNLFPGILSLDLYNESKLLKHINGDDAATIDEMMFLQISDMFKSSDQDNHIIAMEIMANCNYIESLLYIEMLFKEYYHQMSNCHTKNHVNFKSLISFLGKNKNYMSTSIDDIVNSLINKDVLDVDKVSVIMKHYGEEIAAQGGTNHFEIKSVTLCEDTAKLLNTNYVHQTFPDYIPEGDVEVPEIHGDLADLNSLEDNIPGVAGVATGVDGVESDLEITDEDIETALLRIERKELKSELIALEEENPVSESELNKTEEESNNNQIEEDDNGFEWF
jgi:hypothetical protein